MNMYDIFKPISPIIQISKLDKDNKFKDNQNKKKNKEDKEFAKELEKEIKKINI